MEPDIEKNWPIPVERSRYPFAKLEVGESFEALRAKEKSVRSLASMFNKANPDKRITVRVQDDETLRIWRKS